MSTVKKSQATPAWECRNWDQVTSERFGAGSMLLTLRMFHTVEEAMRWPRLASSPVAPGRILGRETDDESAEFDRRLWSSWSSVGLSPVAGDPHVDPRQIRQPSDDPGGGVAVEAGGPVRKIGPVSSIADLETESTGGLRRQQNGCGLAAPAIGSGVAADPGGVGASRVVERLGSARRLCCQGARRARGMMWMLSGRV